MVINNGICAYFIGKKQEPPGNTFFPLSPHELSKLTLVFTKTTLVPLGTNTALGIENTKSNIIPRFPREKISHFTAEGQGELRKTMKKYTVLRNQVKSPSKVAFALLPMCPKVTQASCVCTLVLCVLMGSFSHPLLQ